MANFGEMLTTLNLLVQGNVATEDQKKTLNNSQRQIIESFEWSFCFTDVVINSMTPRSNGTVTVTTGSTEVFGDGTTFFFTDVGSFLWVGSVNCAPIPIVDVQGEQMLTLAAPWPGPAMIASGYVLAPLYYRIEGALECRAVRNIQLLTKLVREEINVRDPARIGSGGSPSAAWTSAPWAQDGSLQIELWPKPSDARPYLCEIKRRAPLLIRDTDQPLCPSGILEAKALMDCCLSQFASSGNDKWFQLASHWETRYLKEWEDLQIADARRIRHLTGAEPPRGAPFQWDAQWEPTHDSGRRF